MNNKEGNNFIRHLIKETNNNYDGAWIGQDSHSFLTKEDKENKDLILAGVKIDHNFGLKANSDGDVVIHSLCNALSSSIRGGSLSNWADKMYQEGIKDSSKYLEKILNKVEEHGYSIASVSVAIEAKEPKLENKIEKMENNLAEIMGINIDQVGMTVTSGEELTSFGRGEGIQAISIVKLFLNQK